ncbi:MAG: tetratricopeptide repeat protein [Bryobacteraceae bacterium]|nr:tetratricopeptide repeat protein [Bryobacteraceae bacterium]
MNIGRYKGGGFGLRLLLFLAAAALLGQAPDPAREHLRRGVQAERTGNYAAARAEYEKALALSPKMPEALANLGTVYLRLGMPERAAAQLKAASELRPAMAPLKFFHGLSLYEGGRYAEAHEVLAKFLEQMPGDARGLHLDGLCLLKLDRYEEGRRQLEQSLARQPGNQPAKVTLATAYVAAGNLERAATLIEGLQGADADLVRGMILNSKGQYREAEKVLMAALASNPKLPSLNNQLGYTLMLLGDDAGAIRAFEAELQLAPKDFNASANLGWILVKQREFARAEALLSEALKAKPANAGVLYLLGQVWSSIGETVKAVAALEQVVKQKPSFRAAHVLLARGYAKTGRTADAERLQAVIRKLTEEEQARNLGANESYADRGATLPDFTEGTKR